MEQVYLTHCSNYDWESVVSCVDEMFQGLAFDRALRPGMRVAVKPNLVMRASPEAAVTTHPVVTAAVCCWLAERGAEVVVVESPGGPYTPAVLHAVYAGCGYRVASETYGFPLNMDVSHGTLPTPDG